MKCEKCKAEIEWVNGNLWPTNVGTDTPHSCPPVKKMVKPGDLKVPKLNYGKKVM